MTEAPRVPRLTNGGTVVCIGTGPSLTAFDVDSCRGRATVVAVNNAYLYAPWADVLYASDAAWWRVHDGARQCAGLKYTLEPVPMKWQGVVTVLRDTGAAGIETDPSGLRNGRNSGYAAMNLAVHLGAKRIVLMGYDLGLGPDGETHVHGDHPPPLSNDLSFSVCRRHFESAVVPLRDLGIEVVNASRLTTLTCFPRQTVEDALRLPQAVSA